MADCGRERLATTERGKRSEGKKAYRLGNTDILGTMDVNDFWTELFARAGAGGSKLSETTGVL